MMHVVQENLSSVNLMLQVSKNITLYFISYQKMQKLYLCIYFFFLNVVLTFRVVKVLAILYQTESYQFANEIRYSIIPVVTIIHEMIIFMSING